MTEQLKQLREALRRVKYEAASLADAQVIALEALTAAQPAQADAQKLSKYLTELADRLDSITEMPTDMLEAKRYLHEFAQVLKFSAPLPTQPAAQTDSMGMPTSCGKPLCLPDEHHPLCRLHKPAAQATPESVTRSRECTEPMCACMGGPCAECPEGEREKEIADLRASRDFYKRRADSLQQAQSRMRDPERTMVCDILANGALLVPAGGRYAATPEPVGEPVAWRYKIPTHGGGTAWTHTRPQPECLIEAQPLYTHPAPGVPEGFDVQAHIAAGSGHEYPLITVRDTSTQVAQDVFADEEPVIYALLSAWLAAAQAKGGGNV